MRFTVPRYYVTWISCYVDASKWYHSSEAKKMEIDCTVCKICKNHYYVHEDDTKTRQFYIKLKTKLIDKSVLIYCK